MKPDELPEVFLLEHPLSAFAEQDFAGRDAPGHVGFDERRLAGSWKRLAPGADELEPKEVRRRETYGDDACSGDGGQLLRKIDFQQAVALFPNQHFGGMPDGQDGTFDPVPTHVVDVAGADMANVG